MKTNIHVLNVGHGDSILVLVKRTGKIWTMLIDGGPGHAHVGQRLKSMNLIPTAVGQKPRIDLMVASHHDKDHLEGLVDIVKSDEFDIRHVWAPIIFHPHFDPLTPDSGALTLTEELLVDDNAERRVYTHLETALRDVYSGDHRDEFEHLERMSRRHIDASVRLEYDDDFRSIDTSRISDEFQFLAHMVNLGSRVSGIPSCGKPLSYGAFSADFDPLEDVPRIAPELIALENDRHFALHFRRRPRSASEHLRLMAAASTSTYFNVKLTAEFIREVKKRNIPITMPLAQLRGQRWCDISASRGSSLGSWQNEPVEQGLRIELLAPTKWLAEKLKAKLTMPPGTMLLARAMNHVTVPNRVSYVFNLHVSKATALFTGDSGFTDFHEGGHGKFHEKRVERIAAAGWIKVPHHAGHFHRFARAINHMRNEMGYSTDAKWFVTSLGNAVHNPSLEFEELAQSLRDTEGPKPIFDFTNGPQFNRFDAVCKDCPRAGQDGETNLHYANTSSGKWKRISPTKDFCCTNYL